MVVRNPPAHLMGAQTKASVKRRVTPRLHNRRISMDVTPEGDYQMHTAKALAPSETAELRAHGHRDSLKDYFLRDRVRYSFITLSAEAFEATVWCYEKLKKQHKRASTALAVLEPIKIRGLVCCSQLNGQKTVVFTSS